MDNIVFGKTMENLRKDKDIIFVKTKTRRNYLVSEPNYHTTKNLPKNLLTKEMIGTWIIVTKPVYLGPPILEISEKVMYEILYSYVNKKMVKKQNYITWIKTLPRSTKKQKTFTLIFQKMLKQDLTVQITNQTYHY